MVYNGEQLIWGQAGNALLALGFAAALLACIAYFFSTQAKDEEAATSWGTIAKNAFRVHAVSVFGIAGILLYLLVNHRFEYYYVFWHSNKEMPMKYILSCLWEGQEGSFLLWTFWHVMLGLVLMRRKDEWAAPVMAVLASVQVFLISMLLGVWFDDYKLGSNPFILLREHQDYMNLPFIQSADYLSKINGRGLNPLLQNYWMTIHPPTLFLGFASTVVPFCFAIAGLWKRKYTEWLQPALPWTFFGVMILGTGILMGGAWAYEALSFGGFWAWDPVENASLVPWITLVAAAHVMLIFKNKGQSLILAFSLCILTFVLILYSTFLTRSGILGDTSVHAFTDLGMSGQLLIYLLFYFVLGFLLLIIRRKEIPAQETEEKLWSREFWMFVGALVLCVSAFQVLFSTSIPVINKTFGSNLAPPLNVAKHYNSWQVPIAVIVAILLAFTQYLKYKNTDFLSFLKSLLWPFVSAMVLTFALAYLAQMGELFYLTLLFASSFAITANTFYWASILKTKWKTAGASIAHVGFGMILLGALISNAKQKIISQNTSGIDTRSFSESLNNNENILLNKLDTLQLGDYHVVYKGRRKEGINIYYDIEYLEKGNGTYASLFTLHPLVQLNERMGNVAEPDTKHFLHKDVYTHITMDNFREDRAENPDAFVEIGMSTMKPGDSVFAHNSIIVFEGFDKDVSKESLKLGEKDVAVAAVFKAYDVNQNIFEAKPKYGVSMEKGVAFSFPDTIQKLGLAFEIKKLIPQDGKIEVKILEKNANQQDFVIMKAIVFPGINILWAGCLIMVIGTVVAIRRRISIG
jgi:cytochrome c-type biogenesis protein CcmF